MVRGSGAAWDLRNAQPYECYSELDLSKQNNQGETARSWINSGPNKDISPSQLKQAIGPDVLDKLEQQTGLSQEELLARLSRELPTAVDKYTPEGRLPAA